MISLMYLAMNPNITAEQFKEIAEAYVERRCRMLDEVSKNLEDLPLEAQLEYLNRVLPLVFAW